MKKIKVGGRPVDSRYSIGGYAAGEVYEVTEEEAKELVEKKLASYSRAEATGEGDTPTTNQKTDKSGGK